MFTIWPAYAAFEEDKLGTIEVGKRADFTVFDTDVMTASGPDILNAQTVLTIVDGHPIYEKTE
jgi:predicted amidohydrolase YtcJ